MSKYSPIYYAQAACDTMMRKFAPEDLPPKGHFHYHQGVFLSGMLKTWSLTGNQSYFQYVARWIHSVFSEDGQILNYSHAELDDIQPGILLYTLWDETKDPFYRACIESDIAQVPDIPRCDDGGFYHKVRCSHQMWLDGIYMLCPFIAEYARRFDKPEFRDQAVNEIRQMRKKTRDEKTGLWVHAQDESRKAPWADPVTGKSPEFWGRSLGWVPVGILDVLAQMEPDQDGYDELVQIVKDLLDSVLKFQSEEGRWYQILDKGDREENWLENSCSSLFAAGLARAYRTGIADSSALSAAEKAFDAVTASLMWDGDDLLINHVCVGTGVGDYPFYINRPCSTNDLHAVGSFLLMCTELQMALDMKKAAADNKEEQM